MCHIRGERESIEVRSGGYQALIGADHRFGGVAISGEPRDRDEVLLLQRTQGIWFESARSLQVTWYRGLALV